MLSSKHLMWQSYQRDKSPEEWCQPLGKGWTSRYSLLFNSHSGLFLPFLFSHLLHLPCPRGTNGAAEVIETLEVAVSMTSLVNQIQCLGLKISNFSLWHQVAFLNSLTSHQVNIIQIQKKYIFSTQRASLYVQIWSPLGRVMLNIFYYYTVNIYWVLIASLYITQRPLLYLVSWQIVGTACFWYLGCHQAHYNFPVKSVLLISWTSVHQIH